MTDNLSGIVTTIASALPSIIALIRENHAAANPNAPVLTDAEVFAALQQAVDSSVAVDEAWKAQHPTSAPNSPRD